MLKKWTQVVFIGASIIALAACSSNPKNAGQIGMNSSYGASHHTMTSENDSAESSGLGVQSSFHGQQVSSNTHSATATSNAAGRIFYFDFDKDIVHDADKASITAHANYLVAHRDSKIILEGHTDPRGSREYNIGLGERRAKAVVAFLTSRGVNPSQIRVVSYGAEKLAEAGHSEVAFQKDRRAVIVYAQN
jgi:peptidoglycan-associated lipoprotein